MSAASQQLLDSFDALAEADKHRVAVEIMRRFAATGTGDLPEEALVEAADDLFLALDAEEARHASR
ncbi:MAG TPA: hypothetical protein DDY78_13575 [Planctomycetales bacterium]|jgi:hypothetical protein|nr:hypothetical protein [Planctomycetales bacterium]